MQFITSFANIASRYDAFIVDLWGVVHDGIAPFPAALDCLSRLCGRPVLLLSNAPRRAASVQRTLRRLGIDDGLYSHILTSGEATWQALCDRTDPWFAALGSRAYHIGPPRDRGLLEGIDLTAVQAPTEADFVLNTGPDDERDTAGLRVFLPELAACRAARLPMICANPDLEIIRGGQRVMCAGALAAWYEADGGDVRWIGKPDPAIYRRTLAMLGTPHDHVLAIGDSLRTDIAGAAAAGIDSLWIWGGIHAAELGDDHSRVGRTAVAAGVSPIAAMPALAW